MKKNILVIITILLISSFFGCKKYEEGPWLSCRSKKNRLLGYWEVKKYLVNNNDSTSIISETMKSFLFNISKELDSPEVKTLGIHGDSVHSFGSWDFLDNMKEIIINIEYTETYNYSDTTFQLGPFKTSESSSWHIRKLKQDELIIENQTEGTEYRIEYYLLSDVTQKQYKGDSSLCSE